MRRDPPVVTGSFRKDDHKDGRYSSKDGELAKRPKSRALIAKQARRYRRVVGDQCSGSIIDLLTLVGRAERTAALMTGPTYALRIYKSGPDVHLADLFMEEKMPLMNIIPVAWL